MADLQPTADVCPSCGGVGGSENGERCCAVCITRDNRQSTAATALDQAHCLLVDRYSGGGPHTANIAQYDATIARAIRDGATAIRRLVAQNDLLVERLRRAGLLGEPLEILSGGGQLRG